MHFVHKHTPKQQNNQKDFQSRTFVKRCPILNNVL